MPGPDHFETDNRDYQHGLAASLVGNMGIDDAVETCLAQRLGRRAPTGAVRRAQERRVAVRLRMNHYAEPLAIPGARGKRMMDRLRSSRDLAWRDLARRMRRTLV